MSSSAAADTDTTSTDADSMAPPPTDSSIAELYCATIQALREDNIDVIQARLFERMTVSRPTVSDQIRALVREGYLTSGRKIGLTTLGQQTGDRLLRRQRLSSAYLIEFLGIAWPAAFAESERWRTVISDDVEQALIERLGRPEVCPYGNPIPYTPRAHPEALPPEQRRLDQFRPDETATIRRIRHELGATPGLLDFLFTSGLVPGSAVTIIAVSPDGTQTVDAAGQRVGVGPYISARILVTEPD